MPTKRFFHESLYQFDKAQPSYWEATAGAPLPDWSALTGDQTCEVAVIGGGFTGMSTALHLARDHGSNVRVLEAGHIGWGASGRNGGFCSVGGTKMSVKRQIRKYGKEQTYNFFQSQTDAIALCKELIETEEMDFKPLGHGEWVVAESAAHFKRLCVEAEEWTTYTPVKPVMLSQEEFARAGYEAPHQHGAMLIAPGFGLHPLRYIKGIARAAAKYGADISPNSEVLRWEKVDGKHRLECANGTLTADKLVVACNGFMPEHLSPKLHAYTLPLQSVLNVTRPLTDEELALYPWHDNCPAINSPHVYVYYRLLPDNRIMMGGRGDGTGTPEGAHKTSHSIHATFSRLFPKWSHVEFEYNWRGLICFSQNFKPALTQLPSDSSVYLGFGYHGGGVAAATWVGQQLADRINDEKLIKNADIPAIYKGMPPRFPLPALRRVYGRVGLEYYLTIDRFKK